MTTSVESVLNVVREIDSKKSQTSSDRRLIELHNATNDFMVNQGKVCTKEELVDAMKASIIDDYVFNCEVPKEVKRYLWVRGRKEAIKKSWNETTLWRPAAIIGAVCLIGGIAYDTISDTKDTPKTVPVKNVPVYVSSQKTECAFVIVSVNGKKTGITRMKHDQTCYYILCKAYKNGTEFTLDVNDYELGASMHTSCMYVGVSNEYYQHLRAIATSSKPIVGEAIPPEHLTGRYLRDSL